MAQAKVFYLIFGTAATVHDATEQIPISKTRPVKQLSNLYSRIKKNEKGHTARFSYLGCVSASCNIALIYSYWGACKRIN